LVRHLRFDERAVGQMLFHVVMDRQNRIEEEMKAREKASEVYKNPLIKYVW